MMISNTVGIDPLITRGAVLSKFIDYYGKEYKRSIDNKIQKSLQLL